MHHAWNKIDKVQANVFHVYEHQSASVPAFTKTWLEGFRSLVSLDRDTPSYLRNVNLNWNIPKLNMQELKWRDQKVRLLTGVVKWMRLTHRFKVLEHSAYILITLSKRTWNKIKYFLFSLFVVPTTFSNSLHIDSSYFTNLSLVLFLTVHSSRFQYKIIYSFNSKIIRHGPSIIQWFTAKPFFRGLAPTSPHQVHSPHVKIYGGHKSP